MELNLLPQDIDKFIKEAIIKSALGKNIDIVIDQAIRDCINVYDNPLKKLVREIISDMVKNHLSKEENRVLIYGAITKIITSDTVEDILYHGIKKLHKHVTDPGSY